MEKRSGNNPSLAAANERLPAVKVFALSEPKVDIKAPKVINVPPATPSTFVAASAKGAVEFINSSAGTIDAILRLTKKYKTRIVITDAINTLGIVLVGSITLSAGMVAVSIPIKDHMTNVVTVAIKDIGFSGVGLTSGRFDKLKFVNPIIIIKNNGRSFKIVDTS